MEFLIKTGTAGWYQKLDAEGDLADGKHRKPKGEYEVYDTVDEAKGAFRAMQAVNGTTVVDNEPEPEQPKGEGEKAAAKMDAPTTVAPTGKVLYGKTVEITCQWDGCNETRVIKPQDAFQVKFCVAHQKQNRRDAQKAKRKAKAAERKAAKAAA